MSSTRLESLKVIAVSDCYAFSAAHRPPVYHVSESSTNHQPSTIPLLLLADRAATLGACQCRRVVPYSRVVADMLGRLTLLPGRRALRLLESILPLADACDVTAHALLNLCRKCAAQSETQVST